MNKSSAVGIFLSLVACAGVAFAVVEMRKLTGALNDLDARLARLDGGAGSPASGTGSGTAGDASADSPKTIADVAAELKKLQAEVAAVKTSTETLEAAAASGKGATGGNSGSGVVASDDAVKAAVEKALKEREEARDKERRERGARMGGDWAGMAQNAILDTLTRELGLTDQQKTQVSEILKNQTTAFMGAFTNRQEGEDMRTKMEEIRKDTDTKIKGVLTPEQGAKYDELAKDPQKLFGGGMGGWGGGGRGGGSGGSGGR